MKYDEIEFVNEKGERMEDVGTPTNLDFPGQTPRYLDNSRVVIGDGIYEVQKSWADDSTSYLKVWLKRVEDAPKH